MSHTRKNNELSYELKLPNCGKTFSYLYFNVLLYYRSPQYLSHGGFKAFQKGYRRQSLQSKLPKLQITGPASCTLLTFINSWVFEIFCTVHSLWLLVMASDCTWYTNTVINKHNYMYSTIEIKLTYLLNSKGRYCDSLPQFSYAKNNFICLDCSLTLSQTVKKWTELNDLTQSLRQKCKLSPPLTGPSTTIPTGHVGWKKKVLCLLQSSRYCALFHHLYKNSAHF